MVRPAVALPGISRTKELWGTTFPRTARPARQWGVALLVFLACSLPSLVLAQKVPVGPEFQVNSYTTGFPGGQYKRPRVASDSAGNFVVVWDDSYQYEPFARKFSSDGVPLGPEFPIADGGYQSAVASDAAGNFVVVWAGYCGNSYVECARRFDSTGSPLGAEFTITTDLSYYVSNPKVASDAAGNFVVAWQGDNTQTYQWGHVWARRFDSTGTPLDATGFQVTTSSNTACCYGGQNEDTDGLEIASDSAGNFMLVWNQDDYYVFGRVFDSAGVPAGPEFEID